MRIWGKRIFLGGKRFFNRNYKRNYANFFELIVNPRNSGILPHRPDSPHSPPTAIAPARSVHVTYPISFRFLVSRRGAVRFSSAHSGRTDPRPRIEGVLSRRSYFSSGAAELGPEAVWNGLKGYHLSPPSPRGLSCHEGGTQRKEDRRALDWNTSWLDNRNSSRGMGVS